MAVYLDNNATTALDEKVLEVMLPYMGQVTGNPASVHRYGRDDGLLRMVAVAAHRTP